MKDALICFVNISGLMSRSRQPKVGSPLIGGLSEFHGTAAELTSSQCFMGNLSLC